MILNLLCVFVGYNERYKGYRCYHPPTGQVYINRHVLFDETRLPYTSVYKHLLPTPTSLLSSAWRLQYSSSTQAADDTSQNEDVGPTVLVPVNTPQPPAPPTDHVDVNQHSSSSEESSESEADDHPVVQEAVALIQPATNSHKMTTRGKLEL